MLMLGARKRRVEWKEAGVTLTLLPLGETRDQELAEATTERVMDDNGQLKDLKRDVPEYVRLIGRECIADWDGVCGDDGEPVACTPERIDEFMQIQPARDFVLRKVRGLDLYLGREVEAAKKD